MTAVSSLRESQGLPVPLTSRSSLPTESLCMFVVWGSRRAPVTGPDHYVDLSTVSLQDSRRVFAKRRERKWGNASSISYSIEISAPRVPP